MSCMPAGRQLAEMFEVPHGKLQAYMLVSAALDMISKLAPCNGEELLQ